MLNILEQVSHFLNHYQWKASKIPGFKNPSCEYLANKEKIANL